MHHLPWRERGRAAVTREVRKYLHRTAVLQGLLHCSEDEEKQTKFIRRDLGVKNVGARAGNTGTVGDMLHCSLSWTGQKSISISRNQVVRNASPKASVDETPICKCPEASFRNKMPPLGGRRNEENH